MEYDPIKEIIAVPMRHSRLFRRLAYRLFELGFLRVRYVKRELARIIAGIGGNIHVLDAGFGFGPYVDYILRRYPDVRVTGIEIRQDQVEDCERFFEREGFSGRTRLLVGDLVELSDIGLYNLALAVDILEHIEDDVAVLRNLHRALDARGLLLIHTPAFANDSRTVDKREFFVGEHVRDGYTVSELEDKLYLAGFSDVRIRYTYGRWGMISWWLMQGMPMRMVHRFAPAALLLPFYYALVTPFAHRFMLADLAENHESGGGLLAIARK